MTFMSFFRRVLAAAAMSLIGVAANAQQAPSAVVASVEPKHQTATRLAGATKAVMLAATRAGQRVVAVGDHGVVLLSDDGGVTFRQAAHVPTRVPLTGVSFVDDKEGWACGHWGVVLHTVDGGEKWTIQRSDSTRDQPLFSIWFGDRQNGIAVGLWALMLRTSDGGKTWSEVKLPASPGSTKVDKNLYQVFSDGKGLVLVAAEQGLVYRSGNGGASWEAIQTGNKGTFWTGVILDDGWILVAGLGGKVYGSHDTGKTWLPVETGTRSSITGIAQLSDGRVFAVGLDGTSMTSDDRGTAFVAKQREDRLSMTTLTLNDKGKPVVFSKQGPLLER